MMPQPAGTFFFNVIPQLIFCGNMRRDLQIFVLLSIFHWQKGQDAFSGTIRMVLYCPLPGQKGNPLMNPCVIAVYIMIVHQDVMGQLISPVIGNPFLSPLSYHKAEGYGNIIFLSHAAEVLFVNGLFPACIHRHAYIRWFHLPDLPRSRCRSEPM